MKNSDFVFEKYKGPSYSPLRSKRQGENNLRRQAEIREVYKTTNSKKRSPDIYVKNIITSPNIINIHTTNIRFDDRNSIAKGELYKIYPQTEKYKKDRHFQFDKSNDLLKGVLKRGRKLKKGSDGSSSLALQNFQEGYRLSSKDKIKQPRFKFSKDKRSKTLEHSESTDMEPLRRHKTTLNDDSEKSFEIITKTIDRELQMADIDFKGEELDWKEVEVPLKPTDVINYYQKYLTELEKTEILEYENVYFIGHKAHKVNFEDDRLESQFDNKNNEYRFVLNDHVAYRYELLDTIGRGAFGQVIKVYDHKRKCHAALKIIKNKDNFFKQALVQLKILKYIRQNDVKKCANIVSVKDFVVFRNHACIIFELLDISLYDFMKKNEFQGFTFDLIRKLVVQILQSLTFLRAHKIIHCDLKPENIVLRQSGKSGIRLIDFGTSCFQYEKIYTYIQSRFYRAPEIVLSFPYDCNIDMWSFGCIAAQLYTGYPLFPAESENEHIWMIYSALGAPTAAYLEKCPRAKNFFNMEDCTLKKTIKPKKSTEKAKTLVQLINSDNKIFVDFVVRCLKWEPDERISPLEALKHDFIVSGLPEEIKKEHLKNMNSKNPYNLLPTD